MHCDPCCPVEEQDLLKEWKLRTVYVRCYCLWFAAGYSSHAVAIKVVIPKGTSVLLNHCSQLVTFLVRLNTATLTTTFGQWPIQWRRYFFSGTPDKRVMAERCCFDYFMNTTNAKDDWQSLQELWPSGYYFWMSRCNTAVSLFGIFLGRAIPVKSRDTYNIYWCVKCQCVCNKI